LCEKKFLKLKFFLNFPIFSATIPIFLSVTTFAEYYKNKKTEPRISINKIDIHEQFIYNTVFGDNLEALLFSIIITYSYYI